ncbi:hypothetical protein [Enterocloster bolteae]|uniref:hypothetical protein n=1 Tax=Enterocloster bolteae TaxID=208479 RepID=UPI003AF01A53
MKEYNIKESEKRRQPQWEREEVAVLVSEYFRTKDSLPEQERSVELVSKILRQRAKSLGRTVDERYRNITGIKMKFANMQALDKDMVESGHVGLTNTSALERQMVLEYKNNMEKVNQEAYFTVMKYIKL